MNAINKKTFRIGIIIAEALLLLFCIARIIKTNEFRQFFSYNTLESGEGLYLDSFGGEGGCYVDNSMDSRENCIGTPPVLLRKGAYDIRIHYETSTNDQSYSFFAENATYRVLSGRERRALEADRNLLTLHVNYGKDVNEFQIRFNYSGNGYLTVRNVEIIRTKERERQQFFLAILFILLVEGLYWCERKGIWKDSTIDQKNLFLLGCALIVLSSYPLLSPYLYETHDLNFHLMRIEGIKDGLLAGEFPVRLQPSWLGGNGYAVSVFYGDLFLYIPAFLRIIGFSIPFSYNAYVLLINILTAAIAYFCAKDYSRSRHIGFLGAVIYTLAPYRLTCVFVRGAVGEYTAMAFIPLVFYGLYGIAFDEEAQKKGIKKWMLLVLGFSGIIQSHIITCEIVGVLFIIVCIVLWRRLIQRSRLLLVFKAGISTVAVNASFLIPFLDYMKIGGIKATEANTHSYIQSEGILGSQLFSIFPHAYGRTYGIVEGAKIDEMSLSIGLPFVIGIVLCLLYYINGRKTDKQEYKRNVFMLAMAGILLFMGTIYFPWDWLADKGRLPELMVENIQYPWRFLGIASFFLSVLVCSVLVLIYKDRVMYGRRIMLIIGAAAVAAGGYFMSSLVAHNETLVIQDESQLDDYGIMGAEYLPLSVNAYQLRADEIVCGESIVVTDFEKHGTKIAFNIMNHSETQGKVTVPLVYYRGYHAEDRNTKAEFQVVPGDNGRVTCIIPSMYSGNMEIRFKEPIYWRIAEIISIAGIICIVIYSLREAYKWRGRGDKGGYI